ncbi:extracellular solute-binding protein [Halapricum hydrolyticum]|uniref:Extracellular solute-binding protein n=1 Tax=Halapricum hydrolyticum TaxID=2979991 RepID=A0AAE3LJL1_9EURY|nr:extracellular solute-binding protein [Halapricum hydrolyticum]MCU4718538.1 extracellular solute-binding protein [Halapricum hydrolyticum]MCU4727443.1 extracellular solute-binding protein [Halapricum hydrolyticum]
MTHSFSEEPTEIFGNAREKFNTTAGTELEMTQVPDNFVSSMLRELSAGQGPPMFAWAHDIIGEFNRNGLLMDMSDDLRVDECAYTDVAWDAVNHDGKVNALPYAAEAPAFIYNKDILDELDAQPPDTIDEMKSIMDDWLDRGNQYGFGQPIDPYFSTWAGHMFGDPLYDGEQLGLDSPEFAAGLRVLLDELKPYMPSDGAYEAQEAVFRDGVAPFTVNGPWTITGFIQDTDFDVGVSTIPNKNHDEYGEGVPKPYMGVQVLFLTARAEEDSETAQVAREFVEWFTTNDEQILNLANNAGYIPVKSSISGSDELPPLVKGFSEQTEQGVLMPSDPGIGEVWVPYGDVVEEAFSTGDTSSLESDLASAAEEIRSAWEDG